MQNEERTVTIEGDEEQTEPNRSESKQTEAK
jgi:hypothetical protein